MTMRALRKNDQILSNNTPW